MGPQHVMHKAMRNSTSVTTTKGFASRKVTSTTSILDHFVILTPCSVLSMQLQTLVISDELLTQPVSKYSTWFAQAVVLRVITGDLPKCQRTCGIQVVA